MCLAYALVLLVVFVAVMVSRMPSVVVSASSRRTRTVSARWSDPDTILVVVPARMPPEEQQRWAGVLSERLVREAALAPGGDAELLRRALLLDEEIFGARATPVSVRWVSNQSSRWASATPSSRSIRVSDRLQGVPSWVLDAVLAHELAHLVVPDHSPAFYALLVPVHRRIETDAYLEGLALGLSRR